jgi:DNA-binding transcriptional MerR regulator
MSPHAAGGGGRHRSFTEIDIRVLYFIKEAKDKNQRYEEIEPVLRELRENSWADLPYIVEEPNMASVPMVPEAAAHGTLEAERRSLLREIAFLHEQFREREAEFREQIQSKDVQLTEQHERIATLNRQLGELDVELRLYRSGRLKPEE